MKRVNGSPGVKYIECINPVKNKWCIRWDVQDDEDGGVNFMYHVFDHQPTRDEVREIIYGWVNDKTDQTILTGFNWNGLPVWLSPEHQANYRAAYELAKTNEAALPVSFYFGTDEDPECYTFCQIDDLETFVSCMTIHIMKAVEAGWTEKLETDLSLYEV